MTVQVGIAGATGYVGAELLRLCSGHPDLEVAVAAGQSRRGEEIGSVYPSLAAAYPGVVLAAAEPRELKGVDVCFLALPHGESQQVARELTGTVGSVIDLAADFRLRDPAVYAKWYGSEHQAADLIARFAYGLPELFRSELAGAKLIAVPGCYPTAAALAVAPFTRSGWVEPAGIVVDAASGVSGSGRSLTGATHFATADEDFSAYGLLDHRHTPEIEQAVGASVLFTPHLAPMNRGILATCYMRLANDRQSPDTPSAIELLRESYAGEPFVVVSERPPSTKATLGSNVAHLTARVDARTGWVVSLCAIDNLVKGAAGQAIQCANIVLGLPETSGLPIAGVYP
ncbi:MAG: N-acetyl-gamma-glutamyl-phosphate reductase [Acidimicrobiales bacterium]